MVFSNETGEFDIEAAGLEWEPTLTPNRKSASAANPYLRGPIPWSWLRGATELGSGTLATGLAVWHLRALNKQLTFRASLYQLSKWTGLSERVTREGLHRLESAGLVEVERPSGRSPTITLVETPSA